MEFTWKDGLRLLRSVTFSRVINAGKISFSYILSDLFKRPWIWGLPLSLAYEPTTSCNLRCPECPSGLRSFTRPTGDADLKEFSSIIQQAKKHVGYLTLYFQGEPYLNKELFEMVQIAQKAKIYTATSTNAHYLDEENCRKTIDSGLERLIISLDGISDESYTKYRVGGSVEKVKEGVFRLVEMKKKRKAKTPSIVIQCIAFSHNEHEIEEIKGLKEAWGVDNVVIKTAQVTSPEESVLLPKNPKLSRYKKVNGDYVLPEDSPNKCWRMWTSPVITQDGKMIPCCFDKDADNKMGSLQTPNSIEEVWNNSDYKAFRQNVFTNRKSIDICKNCSEGVKVWN